MKVGVFTVLLTDRPLEDALDYVKEVGCEAVEIGTGGYPGDAHCACPGSYWGPWGQRQVPAGCRQQGLEISALSCRGNPLHPDEGVAGEHDERFRDTVRLAAELGVGRVITFSGCPGDSEGSERPNWVTCPWPQDFLETLE